MTSLIFLLRQNPLDADRKEAAIKRIFGTSGIYEHGKTQVYVSLQIYYSPEWKRNVSHDACQQFCCFSPEVQYNSNVKVACSSTRLLCIVYRIFIFFADTIVAV